MENSEEQRIRERAYEIWETTGRPEGQQDVHWQQAQSEVMANDAYGLTPPKVEAMHEAAVKPVRAKRMPKMAQPPLAE